MTGLADGQAIVVTQLSASDLTKDYRSDASIDFVSYIQNPATSRDMVERLLYKRSGRFQLLLSGIFFYQKNAEYVVNTIGLTASSPMKESVL